MSVQDEKGFRATWESIPYMTRHIGAVTIVLFFVYVINPFLSLAWFWWIPGRSWWNVLPYFTAPLSYSGRNLNGLITLFMFCLNLLKLETIIFSKRSDIAGIFLFASVLFNIVGPPLGIYAFLNGISSVLTWTVAQGSPWEPTTILVAQVSQCYLPWVNVLLGFVSGGVRGMSDPLLGIIIGHAYMFFTEILPSAGGPPLLKHPLRFLRWFDDLEENERKAQAFGRGRKLGKHR